MKQVVSLRYHLRYSRNSPSLTSITFYFLFELIRKENAACHVIKKSTKAQSRLHEESSMVEKQQHRRLLLKS